MDHIGGLESLHPATRLGTVTYATFPDWPTLLAHVAYNRPLFYHAPLDRSPVRVSASLRDGGKVRVFPNSREASPFTADVGHLDRFRMVDPFPEKMMPGQTPYTEAERKVRDGLIAGALADEETTHIDDLDTRHV